MIRGGIALGVISIVLLVGDLIQRTLIVLLIILFPRSRSQILGSWQNLIAHMVLGGVRLGGARIGNLPSIPFEEGVLILMNHQSLLDIPLSIASVRGGFPWVISHDRYHRGVPLISHMLRLYQYPKVGFGATPKKDIENIRKAGKEAVRPIVIFPEGHRTRDGEILPFKRAGMTALLGERDWKVYLLVVDGFWKCAKLKDFISSVSSIRGELRLEGPISAPNSAGDFDQFILEMRERTVRVLADMREEMGEK